MNPPSNPTRRDFLKTSGAFTVASTIIIPDHVRAADLAKDKIKVGFIGCGGRGTGAASQTLQADSNVELWAMGDVFRDKIDSSLQVLKAQFEQQPDKLNVAEERKFDGLDAYQKVINSGVDVVLLTTSPGFRPLHIKAAVDAGKHVFCEKPMAVDAAGVRSVIESVKKAKEKNLALVDGFVWRWTKANQEAYKRIHAGEIGDILAIYSSYYTGAVDRYPKWNRTNTKTDLEWMIRRWYYHTWLGGDHVVEQAVHSIDKMLWTMKDVPPEQVVATAMSGMRNMLVEADNFQGYFDILPHAFREPELRERMLALYKWWYLQNLAWLGLRDVPDVAQNETLVGLGELVCAVIDGLKK